MKTILYSMLLFFMFAVLFLSAHKGLEVIEKNTCLQHQERFEKFEGYYVTQADRQMCEYLGIELPANN